MERNTKVILIFFIAIIVLVAIMYFSISRIGNQTNESEFVDVEKGFFPALGQGNIEIIEFSDFACPVCKLNAPIVKKLAEEENVTVYYRLFPLSIHKNSFLAALAASCADEQDKFWEYHDILFENQGNFEKENLKNYAEQLNLNIEQFNSCLDSEKYKNQVNKDIEEGKKAGVKGTPTFFVNEKRIEGFQSLENFKNIINSLK